MFCVKCGSKVDDSAVFCTNCGAKITHIIEANDVSRSTGGGSRSSSVSKASPVAASQSTQYTRADIKWTTKEILTGKPMTVLAVALGFWVVLFGIGLVTQLMTTKDAPTAVVSIMQQLAYMSAEFAISKSNESLVVYLIIALFLALPLIAATWIPSLFIVKFVVNRRMRHIVPTAETVAAHKEAASFKWRLSYSIVIGIIDFAGSWMIMIIIAEYIGGRINFDFGVGTNAITNFLLPVIALTIAEMRIRRLTRYLIGTRNRNSDYAAQIRLGKHLEKVPDKYHDEISIAKIARLVELGISGSPRGAVTWLDSVSLRSRIMQKASFLGSALTAIVTFVTFGLFSIVITETGNVTAAFAKGNYDATTGALGEAQRQVTKIPKPYYEIVCVLLAIVLGTYCLIPRTYDLSTKEGYEEAAVATWVANTKNGECSLQLRGNGIWSGENTIILAENKAEGYIGYRGYWRVGSDSGGYYIYVDAADMDGNVFQGIYRIDEEDKNTLRSEDGKPYVLRRYSAS